jgi:SAM-dependent methyltransferase
MSDENFSKQAGQYAAHRPVYPQELYRFIFSHLHSKETAWDAGTGSGQAAGVLAEHFTTVHASDISPQQLNHAVQKPNIVYTVMPSEKTSYPSAMFDLITVAQAIHWFDMDAFYEEVRRVAKTKALIAVFGYGRLQSCPRINPVIQSLYDTAFGAWFSSARSFVEKHYQTIPFPFMEIPSPAFTINAQWTPDRLAGYFNSWSAMQRLKEEQNYHPADEAMKQIRKKLADSSSISVSFPVFLRLGRIHPSSD